MKILISNDDGVTSAGIAALVRAFAADGHEIYVVAPDSQRSAASHSLTMYAPMMPREVKLDGAKKAWALNGTPVDCVKLALRTLVPDAEFVVSGINDGWNVGTDCLYSGTVAAAMEGALGFRPALAVSLPPRCGHLVDDAAAAAVNALHIMQAHPIGERRVLNLNYPDCEKPKGVKVCPLADTHYSDRYVEHENDRVGKFYWIVGGLQKDQAYGDDDYSWARKGYVTLTVLQADLTDYTATAAFSEIV